MDGKARKRERWWEQRSKSLESELHRTVSFGGTLVWCLIRLYWTENVMYCFIPSNFHCCLVSACFHSFLYSCPYFSRWNYSIYCFAWVFIESHLCHSKSDLNLFTYQSRKKALANGNQEAKQPTMNGLSVVVFHCNDEMLIEHFSCHFMPKRGKQNSSFCQTSSFHSN